MKLFRPLLASLLLISSLSALAGCTHLAGSADAPDSILAIPTTDPSSVRQLPGGTVIGAATETGAHVWLGLPYAKPPVGELRWRAPERPEAWQTPRDALTSGSACVQYPLALLHQGRLDEIIGDEDCLYLNVFAPRHAPGSVPKAGARYPVMAWIHGGANLTGESASYDWSTFAAKHGVIVVAMNYRLGPFGWFRHESLWEEGDDELDRSGNFGTLDLIRSLEWVRENIAAFGGDPDNVTIFGESAGGNNVLALLLSVPARGLFHRAISQSGGTWSASVTEAENWNDADVPGRPSARENSSQPCSRTTDAPRTATTRSACSRTSAPRISANPYARRARRRS